MPDIPDRPSTKAPQYVRSPRPRKAPRNSGMHVAGMTGTRTTAQAGSQPNAVH
jgi:hypothetical protein